MGVCELTRRHAFALTRHGRFDYIARSRAKAVSALGEAKLCLKVSPMSRRCELTGVGPLVGHHVSHSNVKTKRRFLPALAEVALQSDALGQTFRLKISNAALRTLDFRGGLDVFLVGARDEALSSRALKIKKQVKAKLATAAGMGCMAALEAVRFLAEEDHRAAHKPLSSAEAEKIGTW